MANKTIIEIYNLKSFLKVKPDGFNINRLLLSFGNMDENKKLTESIDFWLDFKKANGENVLVLCQDILSGKLAAEVQKEKKDRLAKDANNKYAQPVRTFQGGISAEKAKNRKLREDGQAQAKVLKISGGLKYPVLFTVEEGPGRETEQGLIVPTYKNKPEKKVQITMNWDDLKAFALLVQTHYTAFLSSQYNAEREENNSSKNQ